MSGKSGGESLIIDGGVRLEGEVAVSGAKNAALPIMAACLLAEGPVCLAGVPWLRDVATLTAVLQRLGVSVQGDRRGRVRLETVDHAPTQASYPLVRRMRASFCVLGPLLARRRHAVVALPGGCTIGHRPVDLHLAGLAQLGAEIKLQRGYVVARAPRLRGAELNLCGPRGPSVTGTANLLCAATLARGRTVIQGAAREPELVDLAKFLNALGARIAGIGTSTLEVVGVKQLAADRQLAADGYRIIPDRIEAATLLIAAAITGGRVGVTGIVADHLGAVRQVLHEAGVEVRWQEGRAQVGGQSAVRGFAVDALPYPGLPTDVQPLLVALACVAQGRSLIGDTVFPQRWRHVAELVRMGACIQRAGSAVVVTGTGTGMMAGSPQNRLQGAPVVGSDLRATAALVLAGLAAAGRTSVGGIHHLDRGYDHLDQKLNQLGARVANQTGVSLGVRCSS